jgi:hypothetical protein
MQHMSAEKEQAQDRHRFHLGAHTFPYACSRSDHDARNGTRVLRCETTWWAAFGMLKGKDKSLQRKEEVNCRVTSTVRSCVNSGTPKRQAGCARLLVPVADRRRRGPRRAKTRSGRRASDPKPEDMFPACASCRSRRVEVVTQFNDGDVRWFDVPRAGTIGPKVRPRPQSGHHSAI